MNQGQWFRQTNSEGMNVIFIHGINSSEECWRNENSCYWPDLLKQEQELKDIGIYLFSYRTGLNTGYYSLSDVVDSLREYCQLDGVLSTKGVIFVCHSMGGIVARRFLVNQRSALIRQGYNKIGLFLVASPSLGSDYANMLSLVAQVLGHTQATALQFSQNNVWLNDLDKDFLRLKESGDFLLEGKELIEDLPLFLKKWFRKQIVEPFSGARYFGDSYKVPQSDHCTIAKPSNQRAIQHRLLVEFINNCQEKWQELPSISEIETLDNLTVYLERKVDEDCKRELEKDGAMIRIRAPQKMGKTALMNYILDYARNEKGYQTASFNLQSVEEEIVNNLSDFLKEFCYKISTDLGLADKTEYHWNRPPKSKLLKCRKYFEDEILSQIDTPLVIGLDNIDRLFAAKYHRIAADFFGMLRTWYNDGQRIELAWKNLRFILVYSTEDLPNYGINQSPFNVGAYPIIEEFNTIQVFTLAQRYQLNWTENEVKQLMNLMGGHPYLVHKALSYLQNHPNLSLADFLAESCTDSGIYDQDFQRIWRRLEEDQEMAQYWCEVITSNQPISIPRQLSFKLDSLGLIRKQGDQVIPRYPLYQQYFTNHLNEL